MPKYYLSKLAEEDLTEIARYGDENFGVIQSDKYRDQLKQRFLVIAEKPKLFPAVDHIRIGYRRSVIGSHTIYYRIANDGVEIVRVLGRQDISKVLV